MLNKHYTNFVKSSSDIPSTLSTVPEHVSLTGEEAKQMYLNEIKQIKKSSHTVTKRIATNVPPCHRDRRKKNLEISDKDLFLTVQNDDIDTLRLALDANPDRQNKLDEYGWSLLMIACQANSTESAKELMKRGIDTFIRDKAGNSAQSLVIKNKYYHLADILLSKKPNTEKQLKVTSGITDKYKTEGFYCELCNLKTINKEHHCSSTIHNINLSKGKKLPTNYVIPESNKGYQIMLRVGWDKEAGLGPDGSGKKYPIKTVQKQDRKGLGHGKRPLAVEKKETDAVAYKNKRILTKEHEYSRKLEINFRRQFY